MVDVITCTRHIRRKSTKHTGDASEPPSPKEEQKEFWKLDVWEDDARRRRRLVRNPLGSTHPEATLKACLEHGAPDDAIQAAEEEFHAHLAAHRAQQQKQGGAATGTTAELLEDSELMAEDRELDSDNQGD